MAKKRKPTKKKTKKKQPRKRYDLDLIRQAAKGRWPEILASLGGLPADVLDGSHHPCPRCGGKDRFRMVDADAGAVHCNRCIKEKNGDGIAAIQWAAGNDFVTAMGAVADYLGIGPQEGGGAGGAVNKPPPDEQLSWRPWNSTLMALWARKKPGVTPEGIKAAGGRLAKYHTFVVVVFPVWGKDLDSKPPVGWAMFNTAKGGLPKKGPDGTTEWITKPKLTYGSKPGIIGDLDRLRSATVVGKLEGVSDVLTFLSMPDTAPDHAVITNANGCGERPARWMADLCTDKKAYVLHDADRPGQNGSLGTDKNGKHRPGWAEVIAGSATECRNVELPFPVAEAHGKDFRDWVNEGGTFADLQKMIDASPKIAAGGEEANLAFDDPYRIAQANLDQYAAKTGGRSLQFWNEGWWQWDTKRYSLITAKEIRVKISNGIKAEFDRKNIEEVADYRAQKAAGEIDPDDDKGPPFAKKVTPATVSAVVGATEAIVNLSGRIELDTWIPDRKRRSYISMSNGRVDMGRLMADEEDVLLPHSADWFSAVHVPYTFDPMAQCPRWLEFLNKSLEGDTQRLNLLQEWAGYLLLPTTDHQKFMIFEGEGANGKSVCCAGLEAILGQENCSHTQLEDFGGNRFATYQTLGKLLNICADASEVDRQSEGLLKSFTSGDKTSFEDKGKSLEYHAPTARLMIACNNRPRFTDRSTGIWRRVLLIPWRVTVKPQDQVLGMDKPQWWGNTNELPGMFMWAVFGLARLREQGEFTASDVMNASMVDYQLEANPAKQFIVDHFIESVDAMPVKRDFVYLQYKGWAIKSGYRPLSARQFHKEVLRCFPSSEMKKRGPRGGQCQCFIKIDVAVDAFPPEELGDVYQLSF